MVRIGKWLPANRKGYEKQVWLILRALEGATLPSGVSIRHLLIVGL